MRNIVPSRKRIPHADWSIKSRGLGRGVGRNHDIAKHGSQMGSQNVNIGVKWGSQMSQMSHLTYLDIQMYIYKCVYTNVYIQTYIYKCIYTNTFSRT